MAEGLCFHGIFIALICKCARKTENELNEGKMLPKSLCKVDSCNEIHFTCTNWAVLGIYYASHFDEGLDCVSMVSLNNVFNLVDFMMKGDVLPFIQIIEIIISDTSSSVLWIGSHMNIN